MPVVNIEQHPNGSTTAVWEITETEEMLMQYISNPNRVLEELSATTHPQRRLERLAVRALLNKLSAGDRCLRYHDNGRPFFANSTANISISHTKRFAAIIYNEKTLVGCDIECYTRDFSTVKQKALSNVEREYLIDRQHNLQLSILWCAKEAVYKCVVEDGIDFAAQIFIQPFLPEEKGKLTALYTGSTGLTTKFDLRYKTIDDHIMVWTM